MVAAGYLSFAEYGSLESTIYVIPAAIAPGHLYTLFSREVWLAMFPIRVIELRSIAPVEVMEVHLSAAEPYFRSIFDIHTGQELRNHKLLFLRVDRGQVTTIKTVAKRFGVVKSQPDMNKPIALILSELQPASFARVIFRHCYISSRVGCRMYVCKEFVQSR